MQFFQKFDHEDETNPDIKLSTVEKGTVISFIILCKILLKVASKAKTYGDLYKLMNFVGDKIEQIDDKYSEHEEVKPNDIIKDMSEIGNSAENL